MARIIYDEPEDKKKYNDLRKNWNNEFNQKNKKYKGIDFEMQGVEIENQAEQRTKVKVIEKPKQEYKRKSFLYNFSMYLIILAISITLSNIMKIGNI